VRSWSKRLRGGGCDGDKIGGLVMVDADTYSDVDRREAPITERVAMLEATLRGVGNMLSLPMCVA
jgi:hypothetical protein